MEEIQTPRNTDCGWLSCFIEDVPKKQVNREVNSMADLRNSTPLKRSNISSTSVVSNVSKVTKQVDLNEFGTFTAVLGYETQTRYYQTKSAKQSSSTNIRVNTPSISSRDFQFDDARELKNSVYSKEPPYNQISQYSQLMAQKNSNQLSLRQSSNEFSNDQFQLNYINYQARSPNKLMASKLSVRQATNYQQFINQSQDPFINASSRLSINSQKSTILSKEDESAYSNGITDNQKSPNQAQDNNNKNNGREINNNNSQYQIQSKENQNNIEPRINNKSQQNIQQLHGQYNNKVERQNFYQFGEPSENFNNQSQRNNNSDQFDKSSSRYNNVNNQQQENNNFQIQNIRPQLNNNIMNSQQQTNQPQKNQNNQMNNNEQNYQQFKNQSSNNEQYNNQQFKNQTNNNEQNNQQFKNQNNNNEQFNQQYKNQMNNNEQQNQQFKNQTNNNEQNNQQFTDHQQRNLDNFQNRIEQNVNFYQNNQNTNQDASNQAFQRNFQKRQTFQPDNTIQQPNLQTLISSIKAEKQNNSKQFDRSTTPEYIMPSQFEQDKTNFRGSIDVSPTDFPQISPIQPEPDIFMTSSITMQQDFQSAHFSLESAKKFQEQRQQQPIQVRSTGPTIAEIQQLKQPNIKLQSGISLAGKKASPMETNQRRTSTAVTKTRVSQYLPSVDVFKFTTPKMSTINPILKQEPLFQVTGHERKVTALCIGPNCVFSASIDGSISALDKRNGSTIQILEGHSKAVMVMRFSVVLLSGSVDMCIRVWQAKPQWVTVMVLRGHKDFIRSMEFFNEEVVSSSEDLTVRLWDVRKGQLKAIQFPEPINVIEVNTERKLAYFASSKYILVYSLPALTQLKIVDAHLDNVITLITIDINLIQDKRQFLISSGKDGLVKIWDLERLKSNQSLKEEFMVSSMVYIPSVNYLICCMSFGDGSGKVSVWSLSTLKKLQNLYDNDVGSQLAIWDPIDQMRRSQQSGKSNSLGILYCGLDNRKVSAMEFYL